MEKYIVKRNIMGSYDVVDENNKTIAGYNGLSLAEMIASKKNTEAENAQLRKALTKACNEYADFTGSCPYDRHNYEMAKCRDCDNDAGTCWRNYFAEGVE